MSAAASTATDSKTAAAASTTTHQRAVLAKLGEPVAIVTEPVPTAATTPGSVVVRVIASDVAPNAKELYGGAIHFKPPAPFTPGGSCFGVVESVAPDVVSNEVVPGAYVLCNRLLSHGSGAQLLIGAFSLTPHTAAGAKQQSLWKHGGWAQYAVLPAQALVVVPDAIATSVPVTVLIRTLTLCVAHGAVVTRGHLQAGQTVLVGGATGVHGLATVLVSLAAGASAVYVMGRSAAKLKPLTALSHRVKPVITGSAASSSAEDQKQLTAAMAEVNGKADVYVDFYPYLKDSALTTAGILALKEKGIAVLGGGVQAAVTLPYFTILLKQLTLTGSVMYPQETISTVLRLLGSGAIDYSHYRATTYDGLSGVNTAIDAAAAPASRDDPFALHVLLPNGLKPFGLKA